MADRTNRVLSFDSFAVDLDAARITRDGQPVRVEPQVYDLIVLLCTNPGRVVGHDEIIEQVWRGRVVSDSAVASRVNSARKALGDDGTVQRVIKTVRRRGFRFELTPIDDPAGVTRAVGHGEPVPGGAAYVLSATPHGYSLLMKTRSGGARQDWREVLPAMLAELASAHRGAALSRSLAAFDDAADALSCAGALIESIARRCEALPEDERWTAKVGVAHACAGESDAYGLAGRLDAAARPRSVCVTEVVKSAAAAVLDIDATPLTARAELDDVEVFEVNRVGEIDLAPPRPGGPPQIVDLAIPEPLEVSIVVLPFDAVGEAPELEPLATGLRLEIQNALAQLSGVLPMTAGTAMAFGGTAPPDAAGALGVRYVLQGNVRAVGRRMRLMLELYDHRRGGVAWSRSYDASLDAGFDFQDDMTARVVTALDVTVLSGEQARIWHGAVSDLRAIRLQYRGMRDFFRMTKECMCTARESFERLHEMCPHVSMGATWLALCHWFELQRGWTVDRARSMAAVKRWASIAVGMDDADGQAHTALCNVHVMCREFEEALRIGARAVEVRPSCGNANGFYAHALYHCGELDGAIQHARLAIRFTPVYPPLFGVVLAGALHARGDHEEAVPISKEMSRLAPRDLLARVVLCSALAEAGRGPEARSAALELGRIDPGFRAEDFLARMPFRHDEMRAQLRGNLSTAIEARGMTHRAH